MKTIAIHDLSRAETLGRKAMTAVQGGMLKAPKAPYLSFDGSKHDFSLDVQQLNSQTQDITNNNGVNVAFADDIKSTIKPTQSARNSLNVF